MLTTALLLVTAVLIVGLFSTINSDAFSLVIVIGLCILVLFSYGLSPMLTKHSLNDDELVLRQGILFKTVIPLASIKAVERWENGPRKSGVYLVTKRKELFVTSRRTNLIIIHLRKPQRIGMAFARMAESVTFDCLEADVMFRALDQWVTLSSPTPGSAPRA
jgi:hypothetical protein